MNTEEVKILFGVDAKISDLPRKKINKFTPYSKIQQIKGQKRGKTAQAALMTKARKEKSEMGDLKVSQEGRLKKAIGLYKGSLKTRPRYALKKGEASRYIIEKFRCGISDKEHIEKYHDGAGLCGFMVDRYRFYDQEYKNVSPVDQLKDLNKKTHAYLDFLILQSRGKWSRGILHAMEIMSSNLERIHKLMEGQKITIEAKVVHDLELVRERIGKEMLKSQDEFKMPSGNSVIDADYSIEEDDKNADGRNSEPNRPRDTEKA